MITIMRMLAKGASPKERIRGRLMTAGAATAMLLVCLAANLLALDVDARVDVSVLSTQDRRAVTALALALLVVPVMAFAHFSSRLATASRERRLAALRLAGATPRDVRLLGGYESGKRTLMGALFGLALYALANRALSWFVDAVPFLSPLMIAALFVALTVGGVLSGLMAGRHVVTSPLGVARRTGPAGPKAVDLILVLAGAGLVGASWAGKGRFVLGGPYGAGLAMAVGGVLLLFGLVLGAAWLIRASARWAGRRAKTAETLVAARMVEADPRGWARALSVVGLTVFFGSAVGAQQAPVLLLHESYAFPVMTYGLVYFALLIALITSAAALIVHQAEALLDHRRSLAALAASGVPIRALSVVVSRQAVIAALPVCAVAAIGGVALVVLIVADVYSHRPAALAFATIQGVLAVGIGVLAAVAVARAAQPLMRRSLAIEDLRAP
ncbi:hypothetical protein [Nonomuraea sp. NPDC049400]|uniref:hypothetical protein n=1 Tax=Nonomuraea sp. NPDC049400 TaxID=3364352 RepID=UPI0037973274